MRRERNRKGSCRSRHPCKQHTAGAFTGADRLKLGQFELANGGTIFLDEVAELNAEAQAMLLRVLEESEFVRVGGNARKPIKVDVRVIAATNKDLQRAVERNEFREDLYYRLAVLPVTIPSLRERKEDVVALAWHFIRKFAEHRATPIIGMSLEAESLLRNYDWPGNVRELRNAMNRAVVMCTENVIDAKHLPALSARPHPAPDTLAATELEFTRRSLLLAYSTNTRVEQIAKALDIHPKYLPRLLDKVGLGNLKRR